MTSHGLRLRAAAHGSKFVTPFFHVYVLASAKQKPGCMPSFIMSVGVRVSGRKVVNDSRVVHVAPQVLGAHDVVRSTVGLAGNDGQFGHRSFGVRKKQLRHRREQPRSSRERDGGGEGVGDGVRSTTG